MSRRIFLPLDSGARRPFADRDALDCRPRRYWRWRHLAAAAAAIVALVALIGA